MRISKLWATQNIGLQKLRATAERALYLKTDLPFSRPCYSVMFLYITCFIACLYFPIEYLHIETNFISKFEVEHFL